MCYIEYYSKDNLMRITICKLNKNLEKKNYNNLNVTKIKYKNIQLLYNKIVLK